MSDALKDLLTAYDNDILAAAKTGGDLAFVASHYLIVQPELLPPDLSTEFPCLLVYPLFIPAELLCLGARVYRKNYQIGLTLIQESYGETAGLLGQKNIPGLLDNLKALETRYEANTLTVTNACRLVSIDYQMRQIPAFAHTGLMQGTIIVEHQYEDFR